LLKLLLRAALAEARDAIRAAIDIAARQKDFNVFQAASHLSELELTLGDIASAVREAEQNVDFADRRSKDFIIRLFAVAMRETLADALHQAGRNADALTRFHEAERLQAEILFGYPLLSYTSFGFRRWDLQLAQAECAAWRRVLSIDLTPSAINSAVSECQSAEQSATHAPVNAADMLNLLIVGLHRLTVGRSTLYRAILRRSNPDLQSAESNIEEAERVLRQSNNLDDIPRGLLTRAWLRAVQGQPELARADLDEAQQIAERGPMRLHQADIHLHRARLFRDREELKNAHALIERCRYWRRKEELQDAEQAAENW
jgi:tetratricopeptide (TPR) repeat protein